MTGHYKQPATVIAGFPGVGKSHCYNNFNNMLNIYDSDSSKFDKDKFPGNYIEHIKEKIKEEDAIIFVSTHDDVKQALVDNEIYFSLVYPTKELKNEYIKRYKDRGSSESFIKLMEDKFEEFVDSCDEFESEYCNKIQFKSGDTLFKIFNYLLVESANETCNSN